MKTQHKLRHRQQGIALVLFALSMLVLIGIAGLALDVSSVMLDDSRLQNAMDACALSGAQVMMDTPGSNTDKIDSARIEAGNTFRENLGTALTAQNLTMTVEFSETLTKGAFANTVANPRYARCTATDYSYRTQLARVLGIDTLGLHVAAVAGAIPVTPCNLVPLLVCGDTTDTCDLEGESCYGFDVYREKDGDVVSAEEKCYMKACPPGTHCDDLAPEVGEHCGAQGGAPTGGGQDADISPGNFQFLDMVCESGKSGKNCIKQALEQGGAVIPGGCPLEGDLVTSEPGNAASIIDSYNSIFSGSNADTDARSPLWYSQYRKQNTGNNRRVLNIVVGDCTSPIIKGGKTEVPILTTACFFSTEIAIKEKGRPVIWGQFIGECPGNGNITITPDAFETYKIVLYKNPDGADS